MTGHARLSPFVLELTVSAAARLRRIQPVKEITQ